MIYLQLFWEFFKTGLFAVGGGMATIPFLYQMSDTTGWFTRMDLANMIAVGESTPGPIGVNMATYAGFTTAGIFGTICATVGLVCPSVIVIIFVYKILEKFKGSSLVNNVFYGFLYNPLHRSGPHHRVISTSHQFINPLIVKHNRYLSRLKRFIY